ncbi:MAG: IclR family transcriptional regulator [Pseudomonadota bacterium]
MPHDGSAQDTDQIPTNMRLLLLLEEVARSGEPVTPTEVNSHLGLPKPTVHRLFRRLEEEGFVERDLDGRSYSAGERLRRMSADALSSRQIRMTRSIILKKLAGEIGETCNISVPDRDDMVYIDRVETKWPLRIQLPTGARVPFHCSASGKMYLASLNPRMFRTYVANADLTSYTIRTKTDPDALSEEIRQIRGQGYATEDQEFLEGMAAIAVPLQAGSGRLLSALTIHAPVQRQQLSDLIKHLPQMKEAAERLRALVVN